MKAYVVRELVSVASGEKELRTHYEYGTFDTLGGGKPVRHRDEESELLSSEERSLQSQLNDLKSLLIGVQKHQPGSSQSAALISGIPASGPDPLPHDLRIVTVVCSGDHERKLASIAFLDPECRIFSTRITAVGVQSQPRAV